MNFCLRPSKTFQFDILENELSKLTGEVGLDAASETMKNRKFFKTKLYYGLDINLELLKNGLKKNNSDNTFGIWADIAKIDLLPSNSADAVVSTNTLYMLPKEKQLTAVKNLCRITTPEGHLIIDCPAKDKSLLGDFKLNLNNYFEEIKIIYTDNLLSRAYEKIFEKNGWLGSHPIAGTKTFLLISWLISRFEYLTSCVPFGNAYAIIFCSKKKTTEPKKKFDTSQFKIIDKNLFNIFN